MEHYVIPNCYNKISQGRNTTKTRNRYKTCKKTSSSITYETENNHGKFSNLGSRYCRCLNWPQQQIIQSIVDKGCHIVTHSSPGGEWRLSFSGPEATLAQVRGKNQKQAYHFFKTLFYQHLRGKSTEPDGKSVYSYCIKTTMLWVCKDTL